MQILGSKLEIVEFNEMLHGWTVRGNMSDPSISRSVVGSVADLWPVVFGQRRSTSLPPAMSVKINCLTMIKILAAALTPL